MSVTKWPRMGFLTSGSLSNVRADAEREGPRRGVLEPKSLVLYSTGLCSADIKQQSSARVIFLVRVRVVLPLDVSHSVYRGSSRKRVWSCETELPASVLNKKKRSACSHAWLASAGNACRDHHRRAVGSQACLITDDSGGLSSGRFFAFRVRLDVLRGLLYAEALVRTA